MKKKIISLMVLTIMIFSGVSALASFPDMEDKSWDWARPAVDEMVEYGIIRGYSDNTFRPANSITKGEAMVLFSRVVGYTAKGNEEYVEKAKAVYSDKLATLSTPYTGEISYLIYKGILSEKTFLTYAADDIVNTPLKRYEAAEFLAKIATGNAPLSGSASSLNFNDIDQINSTMAPYIKYVSENGIMLGMGDGSFNPGGFVTRAQMTVMLSRIIPALAYEYIDGSVKFYNAATNSIVVAVDSDIEKDVVLGDDTLIKLDGADVSAQSLLAGSKLRITISGEDVVIVEAISPNYDAVINGRFKKLEAIDDKTNGIVVTDPSSGLSSTYALSKSVNIVKNDNKITAADLVKDDYVILTVKSGIVTSIVAESKTATISGKVTDITLLPTYTLSVLTGGKTVKYELAETVKVTRNKKSSSVENILVGDEVTITTTYGVISEIVATSKTSSTEGTITEVIISNTPGITITDAAGNSYTYAIKREAVIKKADAEKTFYDLRVGDKVKLSLDAATVTKIEVTASFANGAEEGTTTNIEGVIEYVEKSHGYIKLVGSSDLIFISKAAIKDSNGKDLTIRSLSEGDKITAFGTASAGSYTASMIVVHK